MTYETLNVDGITKRYGERTAVKSLSFSVRAGMIAGLVGPNGCGKTTTLAMISGIRKPNEGKISIVGYDIASDPIGAKSNLAFVPDSPTGFEQLTVAEYLDLYRSLYRQRKAHYEDKAGVILEAFGLTEYLNAGLGELSHGTRRKVATTAALSLGVPMLLVDEPTVGLDPESVIVLRRLVQHLSQSGCAVLLATQDLAFAECICDYLFLLNEGRIVANGSPVQLCKYYQAGSVEEVFLTVTGIGRKLDGLEERLDIIPR